ncbi:DMT family transporter [Rhizobiaceae bacterium BDR2-2]|uniref:DMT family transporter n=1 Tax=Ectorhizobium quercum TaxID=2965071 RepID=A0AAE3N0K7_9HYPH|nr:DMT family transporter [Ectorhizobium quercum]MCX8998548.1 DMT family transporter [Ectorhizobium quercum]
MRPRDIAVYLFLAIVWGLSFLVLVKAVEAFGWIGAVTLRALMASATLYALARALRRRLDFSLGWKPLFVVGATTVAGQLIGLSYAAPLIGTAMSAILVATIPLFSMIIGAFWGLERINAHRLAGLALGIFGIVLLVGFPAAPVTPAFLFGCAAALFGSFSAAFGSNYASRWLGRAGSWEVTIGAFFFGGLMTFPFLAAVPVPALPHAVDLVWLVVLACGMSALTYVLYFGLVASVGATRAISVEFAVTAVAVAIGALALGEPFSLIQAAGAVVIVAGCAIVLGLFPMARSAGPRVEH